MEHRKLALFFGESIGDSRQSHESIEPEQKAKMSIPTHISFINYSEIMSGDGYETVAVPTEKRLEHIRNAFVSDLEGLTEKDSDGQIHSRVCVFCDRLVGLERVSHYTTGKQIKRAAKRVKCLVKPEVGVPYPQLLLDQYGIEDNTEEKPNLRNILLSPRSILVPGKGYVTCCQCHDSAVGDDKNKKPSLPPFAIARGYVIGLAPVEITRLNAFELAVISPVRAVANVFTFYGGCHEVVRGWHTFYQANVGHAVGTFTALDKFKIRNTVSVVLCGPFTKEQRALVMRKMSLNREHCRKAFDWLKKNNIHFKDIEIPDPDTIPEPIILDES
jgi:hypothetical protein